MGYQGRGTIGRAIVDGAKSVKILGENVAIRAAVHTLGGLSAHAGRSDLLRWFAPMAQGRPRVFLTHGEQASREALAAAMEQQLGSKPHLPAHQETVEL